MSRHVLAKQTLLQAYNKDVNYIKASSVEPTSVIHSVKLHYVSRAGKCDGEADV